MGDDFISDDGSSITIFEEDEPGKVTFNLDDGTTSQDDDDAIGDDANDIEELLKTDVTSLPEDQRNFATTLLAALKTSVGEASNMKQKAEMIESILVQERNNKSATPQQVQQVTEGVKSLADSMTFDEKDYYAPFFKQVAGAIDGITKQLKDAAAQSVTEKAESFKDTVKKFFVKNKVQPVVMQKMDEIASGSPGMYKDLPRLLRFAKAELGIKDTPLPKKTTPSRTTERTTRRTARSPAPKPVLSMEEAFGQAKDELANRG